VKNVYGYLLTGWLFAVLSAWHSRETQSGFSLLTRFAIALAWLVAWPAALAAVLISAISRGRR
jgi:hypothetical protein